ncbi:hypothetical protein P3T22_006736, partial [Paraburkholderia sp. GAS348]
MMGRKGIEVVVSELERKQLLSMSRSRSLPHSLVRRAKIVLTALVQIGGLAEKLTIVADTLSIGQDSIPDGRHNGIFGPENGEVELPLA